MASDNKSLGRFILDGIPPAPRGVPQVEVSFDVDANGILNVKAKDKSTGKEQSIKIEASSGLTDEDIEKMKKDAEVHEEDDKKKKELIEARNIAEQMAYTAEKALKDNEANISAETKNAVEEKIKTVHEIKDKDDVQAIKTATAELSNAMQKIGEEMASKGQTESTPQGEDKKNEGEVKDAEYEEKKDDSENPEDNKESK